MKKRDKKTSFYEPTTGVNCNASKDKYALDMRMGGAYLPIPMHIGCSALLRFFENSATIVRELSVRGVSA